MSRKRHKRTHIRLSSSSCGASLPGRSTSKLLTLTCAEKLSFSFDSCFSLKQNKKKKTEKPKLDFYTYSQLGVDTNHLGNFRAQSGYSSDTRKRPRESTGQRFEANFQSCLSLLLNLDQQRKKKTKHLFFSWLLFASFVLFPYCMGFPDAERFYSKLTHTSKSWLRTKTSLKMPSCKWLLFESLSQHIQTSGASKTAQTLQLQ